MICCSPRLLMWRFSIFDGFVINSRGNSQRTDFVNIKVLMCFRFSFCDIFLMSRGSFVRWEIVHSDFLTLHLTNGESVNFSFNPLRSCVSPMPTMKTRIKIIQKAFIFDTLLITRWHFNAFTKFTDKKLKLSKVFYSCLVEDKLSVHNWNNRCLVRK